MKFVLRLQLQRQTLHVYLKVGMLHSSEEQAPQEAYQYARIYVFVLMKSA